MPDPPTRSPSPTVSPSPTPSPPPPPPPDLLPQLEEANTERAVLKREKIGRLEEAGNLAEAEENLKELINLKINGPPSLLVQDPEVLELKYELAEVQINQLRFVAAEREAGAVWQFRMSRPGGEDLEDTRASRLQLCNALRGLGPECVKRAENMYREVWNRYPDLLGNRDWKIKNGHELGMVLASQGRFEEAALQHRLVWEARREWRGEDDDETVSSLKERLWMLERCANVIPQKQEVLVEIHRLRGRPSGRLITSDILDCIKKLGLLHYEARKFDLAVPKLREVWEARATFENNREIYNNVLGAGYHLALALSNRQSKCAEALTIIRDVCNCKRAQQGGQLDDAHPYNTARRNITRLSQNRNSCRKAG